MFLVCLVAGGTAAGSVTAIVEARLGSTQQCHPPLEASEVSAFYFTRYSTTPHIPSQHSVADSS